MYSHSTFMAKRKIKTTASTLVLLLTFVVVCVSLAAPTLREQRSRLPQGCALGMGCDRVNVICFFGLAPGLSSDPALVSSSPKDISKDSLLLVETGYPSSVSDGIFLTSHGSLSAYQVIFPHKISIHLLNLVLTL